MWLGLLALGFVVTIMVIKQRSLVHRIKLLQEQIKNEKQELKMNPETLKKEEKKLKTEKKENDTQLSAAWELLERYKKKSTPNDKVEDQKSLHPGFDKKEDKTSKDKGNGLTNYANAFGED